MRLSQKSELRFLKFFVYTMGFVFLGAIVFTVLAVYKKVFTPETLMPKQQVATCTNYADGSIELNGRLIDLSVTEPGIVKVFMKNQEGNYVVLLLDQCSGKTLSEIVITQKDVKGKHKGTPDTPHDGTQEDNILS